jgi:putative membrane protein
MRIPLITVAVLVLHAGCERRDGAREAEEAARARDPNATALAGLTGANILAMFERANATDSAAGALAVTKATSSELRTFAAQMVRDHHAMRREGERAARRLRITPEPPSGYRGAERADSILAFLEGVQRGRDFDKAYIDHEVAFHLDFLELVTSAMEHVREAEVQAYIQRLAPLLRDHLDQVQTLQARLR